MSKSLPVYKTMLTNQMLCENRNNYTISEIICNIDNLGFKLLLCTQILTAEFCVEYILNDKYVANVEDRLLFCDGYILCHQKHLTKEDFANARKC